jgi:sulfite reductase (NADPH) flavoprotein alpha-component
MSQRIHLYLSLALGLLLMLSAASGLVLSASVLSGHLQAPASDTQSVGQVAERLAQQLPNIERLERAPDGELRATLATAEGTDEVRVDPLTAEVIGPYQPSATLGWIRDLHRELLLGSAGRWLSGLAALALLALAVSGGWLLARRLGGWHRLLLPIKPGHGLAHWHSVVARWALPVLLVIAGSGVYLAGSSQGWISDGQDVELAYPETVDAAPAAAPSTLSALRNLELQDLRELEFPSANQTNYFTVRTATGEGFVNAGSGNWISYQPHGPARQLYETLYELHTAASSPMWSLILGAASLACLFLGITGTFAWWQRQRQSRTIAGNSPAQQAEAIILVGSQSGSTWDYARQLHEQLAASGMPVHSASMNQLQPGYPRARHLLILTASHGDGQAPQSASAFLQRLARSRLAPELQAAVLGLGDSSFQHFCGYAEQVEEQLREQGIKPLLALHKVDRGAAGDLDLWALRLGRALGIDLKLTPVQSTPALQPLRLLSREVFDEADEAPAAILRFALDAGQPPARFAPGDLLAISPGPGQAPRYYSIASADADGAVEICVRRQPQGLCSQLLHELPVGACIQGFLQPHPDFRPDAGQHPLILVGAGTGLAPLIGFARKNFAQRPLHLYWGGRHAQAGFPYQAELQECLADGRLTQLGLAFSQGPAAMYVQDRLRQDAAELQRLLAQGAQILVCGSRQMAAGVRAVVEALLAGQGGSVEQLKQQGRYREDVY